MAVFLINKAYLNDNTVVDGNIDYMKFRPALQLAQDFDLKPFLGTDLLNALKVHAAANFDSNTVVPEPYKTLLETYVQPALVYFALARATPNFKFKYSAKGVVVKSSDNSQSAETIDIEKQTDDWRNIAQGYAREMVDYLLYNASSFPEYSTSTAGYKIAPKTAVFECPIYLGPDNYKPRFNGQGSFRNGNDE
jgi:hypothetical protein